jgi:Uma2 family endonuclease
MAQSPTATLDARRGAKLTYEEFLALDGDPRMEWVDGEAVPLVSVNVDHNRVTGWIDFLLRVFLRSHPIGELFTEPYNVRLLTTGRSPDLFVVLHDHADRVRFNHLHGPPDLVVEVVSPGNTATDRIAKFAEYEAAGVPEYWIIDPEQKRADFYVLGADGRYEAVAVTEWFESKTIPGLRIRPAWFWSRPAVSGALAAMQA